MAIRTEDAFAPEELISTENAFEEEQPKKKSWVESLFPTAAAEAQSKKPSLPKTGFNLAIDELTIPTRAAAKLRGQQFGNPESYFLRPEVEKLKGGVENPERAGLEAMEPTIFGEAGPGYLPPGKPRDVIVEGLGRAVSDPTFFTTPGKNVTGKGMQKGAEIIERAVLGKGGKSTGQLQNVSLSEVAKNALEYGAGGNMQRTLKVSDKVMSGLDNQLDNALTIAQERNPSAAISLDDIYDGLERFVNSNIEYLENGPEVIGAIKFWKDRLKEYGFSGKLSLKDAQRAKRAIGIKAFKTKGQVTPDLMARENAADLIKLSITDDLDQFAPETKEINKVYRQMIPVKKIAQNRIWTEQAKDPFSYGDLFAGGLGGGVGTLKAGFDPVVLLYILGGYGLYKASKSGLVAQGLYSAGKGLRSLTNIPPIGGPAGLFYESGKE